MTINEKLKNEKSCVTKALELNASNESTAQIINTAYLKTLSRNPTDDEMKKLQEVFSESDEASRREVIEDLYWSLMSSREFLFQH